IAPTSSSRFISSGSTRRASTPSGAGEVLGLGNSSGGLGEGEGGADVVLSDGGGGVGSPSPPVHPKSINEPRTVAATPDTARRVLAALGRRAPCCASNMPGNLPSRCLIRTGASESVDEGAPQRRRGGLVHP